MGRNTRAGVVKEGTKEILEKRTVQMLQSAYEARNPLNRTLLYYFYNEHTNTTKKKGDFENECINE